jgi:acetyltransferase-like isoleucine patch superfamily enzyme
MSSNAFFNRDLCYLRTLSWWNRARLWRLRRGLRDRVSIAPGCDIWAGCLRYQGSGRVKFAAGSGVERGPQVLLLDTAPGSEILIGERAWFRSKYCANVLTTFENARIEIGPDCMFNGCVLTARERITLGKKTMLAWNVTVLDSDLHDLSNTEPMRVKPVTLGDYVWVGAGATIVAGVSIGSHTIVASGSVVTRDLPDHVLAAGVPAKIIRQIADRDRAS